MEGQQLVIDQQAAKIKQLEQDVKNHAGDIGRLNGILEEKERKIAELTNILANRDPALSEYINFAREAITGFKDAITRVHDRLDGIEKEIKDIA
jgi:chromosome segregation ATPase